MEEERQLSGKARVSRRQFLRVGLGAVGAGLVASCASSPLAPSPSAPAAPGAAATSRRGQLVVGTYEDWQSLNPYGQNQVSSEGVLRHIYDPLLEADSEGKLVPGLAESWKAVDDRTWEFQLRKGVKFHDGTEFTAESVKFSIERLINPDLKSPITSVYYSTLDSAEVKDKYTAVIKTKVPDGALLRQLTVFVEMLPTSAGNQGFFDKPIGTGPFKVVESVRGDRVVMEANPNYWREGIPKLERLTFRFIPEESVRIAGLLAGDIQVALKLSPEGTQQIETKSNLTTQKIYSDEFHFLIMNNGKAPWSDVRVRKAFCHAIDRDKIVKDLLLGAAKPLQSVLPTTTPMAITDLPPYNYDLAMAKSLLQEAGFKGLEGEVVLIKGLIAKQEEIAQAIAAMVAPLGFKLTISPLEGNAARERRAAGNYDLFYTWQPDNFHDPDGTIRFQLYGPNTKTTSRYSNPEVDKLIETARATLDQAKREQMYAQIQRLIWADAPLVFLYQPMVQEGLDKRVQGHAIRNDTIQLFREAYLAG